MAPTISTHIFPHTVSRKHFESIWQAWHFGDNSQKTKDPWQMFKIWPMYVYSVQKLGEYKQELSLDKAMISWQGHLNFRTYNPGKITKYGELVRMVCEAVLGYTCNM
jgi:hypothetical protein